MRRYIIIVALSCCGASGFTQLNIDSLKNLISAGNKEDTTQVERLLEISMAFIYDKPDSGIYYANNALQLSQKMDYPYGQAKAYQQLVEAYLVLGDYAQSMQYSLQALNLYRQIKRTAEADGMSSYLGDIYMAVGDYKKALQYYFEARKMFETNGGVRGLLYSDVTIAEAYLAGNRLDSALFFARRGFAKDRELKQDWTYPAIVLGNVYMKRNQFDSALYCYRSTFKYTPRKDQIEINNGIATIFRNRNQADSCRYYAKMAFDTAQIINYPKGAMQASELLSWVYEKINPVEAIHYYKTSMAIKDRLYNQEKTSRVNVLIFGEQIKEQELEAAQAKYQNRLKMYGLLAIVGFFLFIALVLWRSNQHRQKAYALLQKQKVETDVQKVKAESALEELKSTQSQLIQSEKMASLGELTAGIAHEIQNPLNFVNNFSDVNKELLAEMNVEIGKGNYDEVKAIAKDVTDNEEKINHHGKRADAIVKGMLQHSRSSSGIKEPTDINALTDEYVRLAYHGLRAKDKSFNAKFETDFDPAIGKINVVPQDIGRVVLNLVNNAFYAVSEKKRQLEKDLTVPGVYEPAVTVTTKKINSKVEIRVRDNGRGIPQKILDKIFQPFFTTKPTGQGTGLGLSLAYDIVKAHGGELKVETREGEGSEFIIQLPVV